MSQPPLHHPTALIHPRANVDPSTRIGPYCVIDEGVSIGPDCLLGPHVHLTGDTTIGARNRFHAGAVIGDAPQDLKYRGAPTRTRIGDDNWFRENITIHRATHPDGVTVIGNHNLFMVGSHVGHNAVVGNHVIVANGALLAGHVHVGDRAFISGNCLVHQFVRIGRLALMQGGSAISKDLPPFAIARGDNGICGLNIIGLRRAGVSAADRLVLKRIYHILFRHGLFRSAALKAARGVESPGELAHELVEFVATAKRGLCSDTGSHKANPSSASEQTMAP